MPLNFKFPENAYYENLQYDVTKSIKQQQNSKEKDKILKSSKKTTNHQQNILKTTPSSQPAPLNNEFYDSEFYTTSITTPIQLDKYHFSPNLIQNQMPSVYFGQINFNEFNLKLPLLNRNQFKPIGIYFLF